MIDSPSPRLYFPRVLLWPVLLWIERFVLAYVVICAGSPDQQDFIKLAPDGLAARLGRGERADFLEPLDLDPTRRLAAWRMRK